MVSKSKIHTPKPNKYFFKMHEKLGKKGSIIENNGLGMERDIYCSVIIGRNPVEAKCKNQCNPTTGKSISPYLEIL